MMALVDAPWNPTGVPLALAAEILQIYPQRGRLRKRKIEHAKVCGDAGFRFTALPGAAFRYTGRAAMSRATC